MPIFSKNGKKINKMQCAKVVYLNMLLKKVLVPKRRNQIGIKIRMFKIYLTSRMFVTFQINRPGSVIIINQNVATFNTSSFNIKEQD